jgi:hypothetical protein
MRAETVRIGRKAVTAAREFFARRQTVARPSGQFSHSEQGCGPVARLVYGCPPKLAQSIPGTTRRVEFDGARIFFSRKRLQVFNLKLHAHWRASNADGGVRR